MPSSQQNVTNIPSNRVDFIDPRTGLVSREWYRFFVNLFNLSGAGGNQTSLDDLQVGPPPQPTSTSGGGGSGTVTSVDMTVPTGLAVSGNPITTAGTLAVTYASGYAIPTTAKQTEWDTAYTDRLKWDGGATDLVAATGRTSLGATTVGSNFFTLPNPSAITFVQINADNTITTMDAPTFRTAIGAGTGAGSVTSVDATGGTGISVSGGPITTSGTLTITNTAPDQVVSLTGAGTTAVTGTYPNFTITSNDAYTGTVTSVATAGSVSGLTLTGGPITSSGTVTLGGTLNLSSPPTIGNTAPNTGKFTTLESTGTASLGTASAQYMQVVGDANYPALKAAGSGTNIPLVLQPKGTGALQAQQTDSTATGGNARGGRAVDWQTLRSLASQVASGFVATVSGGYNNTVSGGVSVVGGGTQNIAAADLSVIAGGIANSTSVSGAGNTYSFIGAGYQNSASGVFNVIGGGYLNSGTATAAVTTQSATMNGTTAVTLSGSNASIKVGQLVTGTSITGFPNTYVAAVSGTSLTLSQAASGSSTSTLSFYTPHGVVVGGGNNQATGSYSFIGGGGDAGTAANRNVASGAWSAVTGGFKNSATNDFAYVGGGSNNSVSGGTAVCVGGQNTSVSGTAAANIAGFGNIASGNYSFVGAGVNGTTRSITGNHVFAACSFPIQLATGVSQTAILVLGRETTSATSAVLTSDSNTAATTTNQVILPNNSAYYFKGTVVAGVTGGGNTSSWSFEGTIKRGANAASTTLVGTPVLNLIGQDSGASAWVVALTADTTNGGLKVTVTGQAATTIRWVAKIETTEMTF